MEKPRPRRSLVLAVCILAPFALLIVSANKLGQVSARADAVSQRLALKEAERHSRQAQLKAGLASTRPQDFRAALNRLAALDEQGALDAWQSALENPDPHLQKEAWAKYQSVRPELARKEFSPQIARIAAPPEVVLKLASSAGGEIVVWSASDTETVAAISSYMLGSLRQAGLKAELLYDSVSDWQQARARGERAAQAITPEYQSEAAGSDSELRIAVVDLRRQSEPAPGYSRWLGDSENILLRNDSFLAYLDVFPSDGSAGSIDSRIEQRYARRGYRLAGFYTPAEFAKSASKFFPGRRFDGVLPETKGFQAALSEGGFHSYEETLSEFKALADAHPDIARFVNLGTSYEGRQIFALKVSKDAGTNDTSKPDVLITGCYHAREWISVEPPVYFANQLINNYAADDSIRYLVDHLQIWIVPVVNPDGLTYSQAAANNKDDKVRMWRKNRRPISVDGCASGVGVDLNRNFDFQWRFQNDQPCPKFSDDSGASDDPADEIYRGPRPESESEVKALKSLIDDPNRNFRAQLDYHNFGQLILYPWGYQRQAAPDAGTLSKLAGRMADDALKIDRKEYTPQQAIDLYETTGSSIDYAYGTDKVAAPFLIEVRPDCCQFNVAESDIASISRENWASAKSLLGWAAGPPILESVQAYQPTQDGNFSKLVYSARWTTSDDSPAGPRQMTVDTRFPGIEAGRLQLRLQFSKPMDSDSPPKAWLGRGTQLEELALAATDGTEGWQKTVYLNDTWVGQTTITLDGDYSSSWRVMVEASDGLGFGLDAKPETRAGYGKGTDGWLQYEGGDGSSGGADLQHMMSPTLPSDNASIFIGAPNGGERLVAGDAYTVVWTVPKETGFLPVEQRLNLTIDSGANYVPIVEGLPGNIEKYQIVLPNVATTRARMQLLAREGTFGNILIGYSQTDFTIGANVGAGVEISFVSSEKVELGWTDRSDEPGAALSGGSKLVITLRVTNRGSTSVANPFLRVDALSRGNVLLTRNSKSKQALGALQSINVGSDNVLSPGETVEPRMIIGLIGKKKFNFSVEMYGVPVGGAIAPARAVNVWFGKPKTKN